jgi:hypothetical protein
VRWFAAFDCCKVGYPDGLAAASLHVLATGIASIGLKSLVQISLAEREKLLLDFPVDASKEM